MRELIGALGASCQEFTGYSVAQCVPSQGAQLIWCLGSYLVESSHRGAIVFHLVCKLQMFLGLDGILSLHMLPICVMVDKG